MYKKYVKQVLDFIIALLLLLILSPIIVLVAIITYIDLGSPIFNERRTREGKNKKTFVMYKFRTKKMSYQDVENSNRYTKVSCIIDKYRLNELPQLINVLKGEMSLVGPRPFIPNDDLPNDEISEKRYLVKPGITGLAQVSGGRTLTHKQKLKYDEIYYDNLSFKLDLQIILKTITFILK
ncbi:MAG: sugar transferase [Bacilli bacterium]|nr:sugar transferase [Bacilli bacterium]